MDITKRGARRAGNTTLEVAVRRRWTGLYTILWRF
jgi:hypothetical protein